MSSGPSHKLGRCSPKCPEWAGCAVGCRHPNNSLVRQISFHLPIGRDSYNFWTLQCSSPRLRIFPFLVKIVENTYNLVNSCLIYVKISASQLLCESKGD